MNNPGGPRCFTSSWIIILAFGVFAAILLVFGVPTFVSHGPGKINGILSNLRQLDGAVQEWGIGHGQTGAVLATWADIEPYLRSVSSPQGSVKQVAGERYVLEPLTHPPEAVLTREVEGRPEGTVIRFTTNGDVEIILPKPQGAASGRQPFGSEAPAAADSRRSP